MKLTDEELLTAPAKQKIYKIYDGAGLFVEIPPTGSIRWRFKYKFDGKEKKISLGLYPQITIGEARKKRNEFKKFLSKGIDPASVKNGSPLPTAENVNETILIYSQAINDVSAMIRQMLRS